MEEQHLEDARLTVRRASEQSKILDEERVAGLAQRLTVKRVAANRARGRLGRFIHENSLGIVATALFVLTLIGQVFTGHAYYNEEQRAHDQPAVELGAYLRSGAFIEVTAENWESEFLQMGLFVILTAFLYQRGSSESKKLEEPEAVDQPPEEARLSADTPSPVRRGGLALALYRHSLSLLLFGLFAISFVAHVIGGAANFNEEQRQHGEAAISALDYLGTSRFWFESFQNWQSEFLAVAVLVLATIWLREQGSPQSKPVAASHHETGE